MRNNFYDCLYPLWVKEMNLKDFLHPAVIRISAINHGSLTVALDHVLIIASQRIAKCDLSKSIKKTYIWCCWWCKMSTFQLCVVKRSIILNKTVIKSLLLGRQNRMGYKWRWFTICHECQSCFSSTKDSPSNTAVVFGLGRKWYHSLNHGRPKGGIPV